MPEGDCDPVASLCWSRLLSGPVDPWRVRSPCWSRFGGRACDPLGGPCWSSLFLKDCTPWKGPHAYLFKKSPLDDSENPGHNSIQTGNSLAFKTIFVI